VIYAQYRRIVGQFVRPSVPSIDSSSAAWHRVIYAQYRRIVGQFVRLSVPSIDSSSAARRDLRAISSYCGPVRPSIFLSRRSTAAAPRGTA